jgi:ABC-2 type transport system ATP-binding protein
MTETTPAGTARPPAIQVRGLRKSYGDLQVLRGVDLDVAPGSIVALLGSNGAGKTTLVRILSTLIRADAGTASVGGFDVATHAPQVRESVSLTGQFAAVDEILTGRENLVLVARLRHVADDPRHVADRLLERFGLTEAAGRAVSTYSGGMRRRLDLAAALVAKPPVLFLDEPTTGLDPRSRLDLWATIEGLVADGATVLLTTQYLDEADRLADRIAVIDQGKVIAQGTSDELKDRVGGERLEVRLVEAADGPAAAEALAPMADDQPLVRDELVVVGVRQRAGAIVGAVRLLDEAGVGVDDIGLRRPTLDDVFLALTGHAAEAPTPEEAA